MVLVPVASSRTLPSLESSALTLIDAVFTASRKSWTVLVAAKVSVAVVVPSLTVIVFVAVKVNELLAERPETVPEYFAVVAALPCACWAIAWALWTSLVSEVMPLSAAFSVCVALETESSRLLRSPARALSADEVKKLIGLSRAELTFLPVERRDCVLAIRSAVC